MQHPATFCNMDGGGSGRNEPNPPGCDIGPPGDARHLDGAAGISFVYRFSGVLAENGWFCRARRGLRNLSFGRVTYEAFGPAKSAVRSVDVGHGFSFRVDCNPAGAVWRRCR